MSDPNGKIPVEDRLDIQELFARYVWALDMGDADSFVDCFTEDGCFDHLWQGKITAATPYGAGYGTSGTIVRAGGMHASIWPITSL